MHVSQRVSGKDRRYAPQRSSTGISDLGVLLHDALHREGEPMFCLESWIGSRLEAAPSRHRRMGRTIWKVWSFLDDSVYHVSFCSLWVCSYLPGPGWILSCWPKQCKLLMCAAKRSHAALADGATRRSHCYNCAAIVNICRLGKHFPNWNFVSSVRWTANDI